MFNVCGDQARTACGLWSWLCSCARSCRLGEFNDNRVVWRRCCSGLFSDSDSRAGAVMKLGGRGTTMPSLAASTSSCT